MGEKQCSSPLDIDCEPNDHQLEELMQDVRKSAQHQSQEADHFLRESLKSGFQKLTTEPPFQQTVNGR